MITRFKFNNCFAFNKPVEMTLRADMRTKKFSSNVINVNDNLNILKSIAIYGPNNTGKTSFIKCINAFKRTLEDKPIRLSANIFTGNSISTEAVSFIYNEKEYNYEYKFDCDKHSYVYEKMVEIVRDKNSNETEKLIFLKDTLNEKYKCPEDQKLQEVLNIASTNNILIYTVQTEKFDTLNKIKEILINLAKSIVIVTMNNIPNGKTIEILKNKDEETKKIVNFIKNADIYLDDYRYDDKVQLEVDNKEAEEEILKNQDLMDQMRIVSVYKGKPVPSIIFDSLGTRKIAALASYVVTSIEKGQTLVIDELDSSLHFKITRAIMSMYNSELNKNAQLIATLHDISLLDCKKMFRKEQIWFTDKNEEQTELYSLKDFSYEQSGVRGDTTDIQDRYSKGAFGAIPDPDLISTLLKEDDGEADAEENKR